MIKVNLSVPVDVYLQKRRDAAAAKRFFKRLLRKHGVEPRKIVTDKLRSYGVAHRELIPDTIHDTSPLRLGNVLGSKMTVMVGFNQGCKVNLSIPSRLLFAISSFKKCPNKNEPLYQFALLRRCSRVVFKRFDLF